jgi:hypothetical protein
VPAREQQFAGLSVAAAARASTVSFQPVRRAAARAAVVVAKRPPAAPTPPQPDAAPGVEPDDEAQRFTRTVAELERYVAASRERAPGSALVPQPGLPLDTQDDHDSGWRRLWSRRSPGAEG